MLIKENVNGKVNGPFNVKSNISWEICHKNKFLILKYV